jgi:hypothetical protein
MLLKELTIGRILQRVLLYFGLAIGALIAVALIIALLVYTGHTKSLPWPWIAFVMFTVFLFWVVIKQSRAYWSRPSFWFVTAVLLIVHLWAFAAILHIYPQWREIWFVPVMAVEAGLFQVILFQLFGERKRG